MTFPEIDERQVAPTLDRFLKVITSDQGTIDQVEKLISFDVTGEDDDAQGKAGGLGDVEQVEEDTGAPFTKRWDMQIRLTGANVSWRSLSPLMRSLLSLRIIGGVHCAASDRKETSNVRDGTRVIELNMCCNVTYVL